MAQFTVSWSLTLVATLVTDGQSPDPYEREIKPVLMARCVQCHDAKSHESGLRLDRGAGLLAGGDGGNIIVPGNSSASRLIEILRGTNADVDRMPPEGRPLTDHEIACIEKWIDAGAIIPEGERTLTASSDHWSFQALGRNKVPSVQEPSANNPIDAFVLKSLRDLDVRPSAEADRATLIRRLSLDLRGVVPATEEVINFELDVSPNAYDRLVEKFLASPDYGERWGRHWLDLARFADSNGFTRDFERQVWKYRNWVIQSINDGMPFDQFTIEQLAGDLLPEPNLSQLIATGFHRNTLTNDEGGTDPEQFRVDAIADRVDTTGVVYLGLTLGCARCHHHKFDPISQREYYQFFAFLNNCDEPQVDAPTPTEIEDGTLAKRNEIRAQIVAKEQQLAQQQEEFLRQQVAWEKTITPKFYRTLSGPTQIALEVKPETRDDGQKKLVSELFKTTEVAREAFPLVRQIAELQSMAPVIATSLILRERAEPRTTNIHRRGNFLDLGETVQPDVPSMLPPLSAKPVLPTRLELANWLVHPSNPLTPRVTVNRYWQQFFGHGLVDTENDFGVQGARPTHPELLDWLASRLIEMNWDVKALHRQIVLSATYRQASQHRAELYELDPNNKLLARQSRLRLDAEIIRDSALSAARLLTHKIGGPSVHPPQPDGIYQFTQDSKPWNTDVGEDRYRRGMYTFVWRSSPYPALSVFDAADANNTCTRRVKSNTPLQSLTLANDVQFIECARSLAYELLRESQLGIEARAALLFRSCLVRMPNPDELERLLAFIQFQRVTYAADAALAAALVNQSAGSTVTALADQAAWTAAARVLMNLDEFVTRE